MPNGPVHDRITVAVAVLGSAAMQYDTGEWRLSFIYGIMTLFSGLLFSPDLDLHSESYIRWGWLRFLWWPYKTALPHRHFLSHGLLIGVASRIVYLHAVTGFLLIVLRWAWHVFWIGSKSDVVQEMVYIYDTGFSWYHSIDPSHLLAAFLGLWVGAESHTIADLIWSATKGKRG